MKVLNDATIAKLAEQAARHRAWLSSSAAEQERLASQGKYRDLGDSEALATARGAFPGYFDPEAWQGLKVPAGDKLLGLPAPNIALLRQPDGHRAVVEGALPFVGETPSGAKKPVNLALVKDPSGRFSPRSALVGLALPSEADGKAAFWHAGVDVQASVNPRKGTPAASAGEIAYPNALRDTDLFWRPMPLGAEVSFQLRSPAAPKTLALNLSLSKGQTVRLVPEGDWRSGFPGSAEVDGADGQRVLSILPPSTVDAQGTSVPTTYSLEPGGKLVLHVHASDVAWPLWVDPPITASWGVGSSNSTATSPAHWVSSTPFADFSTAYQNGNLEIGGNVVWTPYTANDYALWQVVTPGPSTANGIYIYRLQNSGVLHYDYPDASAPPAYSYYQMELINSSFTTALTGGGYKNGAGPSYQFGQYAAYAEGGTDSAGPTFDVCANTPAYLNTSSSISACSPDSYDGTVGMPAVGFFELVIWNTSNGGTNQGYQYPNPPTLYVPNEMAWLSDKVKPSLSATPPSDSGGWYRSYSGTVTLSANDTGEDTSVSGGGHSDTGLGIQSITVSNGRGGVTASGGGSLSITPSPACDSSNPNVGYGSCIGNSASGTVGYQTVDSGPTAIPEGVNTISATATSVSGQTATTSWPLKIDRTPPTFTVSGPLKDQAGALPPGDWDLHVDATDPLSGVKSIDIYVDGQQVSTSDTSHDEVQHVDQTCSSDGCPMSYDDIAYNTADYPGATHTVEVAVTDQAGNIATQTFYVTPVSAGAACTNVHSFTPYIVAPDAATTAGLALTEGQQQCGTGAATGGSNSRDDFVSYNYGSCDASTDQCTGPLEVQSAPMCERHLALYSNPDGSSVDHQDLVIRGVPAEAYDGETTIELYTGVTTITVSGDDPATVMAAAQSVEPAPAAYIPPIGQEMFGSDFQQLPGLDTGALTPLDQPDQSVLASTLPCT